MGEVKRAIFSYVDIHITLKSRSNKKN